MTEAVHQLPRLATGVPGLDTILNGGFFRGTVAIVSGVPGAGKTILSNQILFHTIKRGERGAYISLLAESHSRLFAYLSSLSFFQQGPIGDALLYHSASHLVESNDLQRLKEIIKHLIVARQMQLLVIDGLSVIMTLSESAVAIKEFVRWLQAYCESQQCTTLILQGDEQHYPIDTTVDAILLLHNTQGVATSLRELEVRKLRGSAYLEGRHQFTITEEGLHIYPRTEAVVSRGLLPPQSSERITSGIAQLDGMLGGGFPAASMTMIFGTPGSGRTFIGQYFLTAGAAQQEPGLYVGFNEPPDQLKVKANGIGLGFSTAVNAGAIDIIWQPSFETIVDAVIEQLLGIIRQRGVRRLVIDGLEGLQQIASRPERIQSIYAALMIELRQLQVTTLYTLELQSLGSPSVDLPVRDVSMLADNIIFLRTAELHSQLRRLISVQKMRLSDFDKRLREFEITNRGIVIDAPFEHSEGIMTGFPRPTSAEPNKSSSDTSTTSSAGDPS